MWIINFFNEMLFDPGLFYLFVTYIVSTESTGPFLRALILLGVSVFIILFPNVPGPRASKYFF